MAYEPNSGDAVREFRGHDPQFKERITVMSQQFSAILKVPDSFLWLV